MELEAYSPQFSMLLVKEKKKDKPVHDVCVCAVDVSGPWC